MHAPIHSIADFRFAQENSHRGAEVQPAAKFGLIANGLVEQRRAFFDALHGDEERLSAPARTLASLLSSSRRPRTARLASFVSPGLSTVQPIDLR